MKCQIPQISWHSRDPVLSIDFQPIKNDQYRLASGGTDSHVLIWYVSYQENRTVKIECASDLYRHNKSVNVVRFSPNGEFLASGDDEGAMFIWQLKEREQNEISKDDENVNKEEWYPVKLLRGHLEDIYDISWSKDGSMLVSASMDNTAIMWDMQKFVKLHIFSDFKGYVQGVSWDPCNQFIASLGSDRTLRIHNISSKKAVCRVSKAPWTNATEKGTIRPRLFYDDTLKSYCRRLTFTPDGELLIAPSGVVEKGEKLNNTCYVFSRHVPHKPVISLPTGDWYTIAVRCNPFLYKLRNTEEKQDESSPEEEEKTKTMINLPYRMIFAVAACDSVLMYDTEQLLPFACISNIHYTHLTDLTWSPDGLTLAASSTDGYCSFIVFTSEELGEIYVPEEPKEVEDDKSSDIVSTDLIIPVTEETPKDITPVSSGLVCIRSPNDSSVAASIDRSETPKNSLTADKKSEKKSPKMASIKKFLVSPQIAATAQISDEIKKTENAAIISEPDVITLVDSPVKASPSVVIESQKQATECDLNKMDVDENILEPKSISAEKESSVEKISKCKMRLDFSENEKAESKIKESSKKSPKMSIKKFFMPSKSPATARSKNDAIQAKVGSPSEKNVSGLPAENKKIDKSSSSPCYDVKMDDNVMECDQNKKNKEKNVLNVPIEDTKIQRTIKASAVSTLTDNTVKKDKMETDKNVAEEIKEKIVSGLSLEDIKTDKSVKASALSSLSDNAKTKIDKSDEALALSSLSDNTKKGDKMEVDKNIIKEIKEKNVSDPSIEDTKVDKSAEASALSSLSDNAGTKIDKSIKASAFSSSSDNTKTKIDKSVKASALSSLNNNFKKSDKLEAVQDITEEIKEKNVSDPSIEDTKNDKSIKASALSLLSDNTEKSDIMEVDASITEEIEEKSISDITIKDKKTDVVPKDSPRNIFAVKNRNKIDAAKNIKKETKIKNVSEIASETKKSDEVQKNSASGSNSSNHSEKMDVDQQIVLETLTVAFDTGNKAGFSKCKTEPVVILDENASDGDNTTTSIFELKGESVVGKSENDWKLELSQDEDIVPMDVVPIVAESKPESKAKRRVPFVTLSSKPTFKQ